jgi:hypothetical protein
MAPGCQVQRVGMAGLAPAAPAPSSWFHSRLTQRRATHAPHPCCGNGRPSSPPPPPPRTRNPTAYACANTTAPHPPPLTPTPRPPSARTGASDRSAAAPTGAPWYAAGGAEAVRRSKPAQPRRCGRTARPPPPPPPPPRPPPGGPPAQGAAEHIGGRRRGRSRNCSAAATTVNAPGGWPARGARRLTCLTPRGVFEATGGARDLPERSISRAASTRTRQGGHLHANVHGSPARAVLVMQTAPAPAAHVPRHSGRDCVCGDGGEGGRRLRMGGCARAHW